MCEETTAAQKHTSLEAEEQIYVWGGVAQEAAKQPIICTKHMHAKVKNWGG